jgi:GT2 family glycosyltransferase
MDAFTPVSASLSVSIVSYAPDLPVLRQTLRTLGESVAHARASGSLQAAKIVVVDNGPGTQLAPTLRALEPSLSYDVVSGHGNVGYGRGNNLALLASDAEFHLVMNPDVSLEPDAIHEALRFMAANPRVIILAPEARDASGARLYLCKRYPSVLGLALRGFAPPLLRRIFRKSLERYEMRDLPRDRPSTGIPLLSGSFLFCRRATIAAIGGFSDDFFLYFEDYDLSLRAAARGHLAWVPAVRITHHGGHAARKGGLHVRLFVQSAVKFFNRHGWKWA